MVISGPAPEFVERAEAGQPASGRWPEPGAEILDQSDDRSGDRGRVLSRAGSSDGHGDACALGGPEEIGKQADRLGGDG